MSRLVLVLTLILLVPGTVAGQSVLAGGGLGVPSEPLDGRARALGNPGVGLFGWSLLPTDPSAAAGLVLPTIFATFQPATSSVEGQPGTSGHTRFPVLGIAYPFGENVFSVTMSSFLDPEWEVRVPLLLQLAGEEVEAEDVFRSEGGISQVRFGWARRLTSSFAMGISAGQLTGSLERTFTRELDPEEVGPDVEPFRSGARWRASGTVVAAGASWDISDIARLGGSVTWANRLELSPVPGSGGGTQRYSLPAEFRLGTMVTLAPRLAATVGATYADWSDVGDDLASGGTRGSVWSYGGGFEWTGTTALGRRMPLRIGFRHQDLPFLFEGEAASERALTGGIGIHLADFDEIPVARLELGFQNGSRSAGPLSESFLRTTLSLRVSGG